jgi:transaldolase
MRFFLDTADTEEIVRIWQTGFLEGVTTNPTILARENIDPYVAIEKICDITEDLEVHVQLTETESEAMVKQTKRLKEISPRIVVKVPCVEEGYKACRILSARKFDVTMTLCYSPMQALLAAKCGAEYIAPYVARAEERTGNAQLLAQTKAVLDVNGFATKVLAASIRTPQQLVDAALAGVDAVTMSAALFGEMIANAETMRDANAFLADWTALLAKCEKAQEQA